MGDRPCAQFLFSGISDTEARRGVINNILNPTTIAHKPIENVKSDVTFEDIFFILLGAGVTALFLVFLSMVCLLVFYSKR